MGENATWMKERPLMDGQVRRQKLAHRGVFGRAEDGCLEAIVRVHQGQESRFCWLRETWCLGYLFFFIIFHLVSVPEHQRDNSHLEENLCVPDSNSAASMVSYEKICLL